MVAPRAGAWIETPRPPCRPGDIPVQKRVKPKQLTIDKDKLKLLHNNRFVKKMIDKCSVLILPVRARVSGCAAFYAGTVSSSYTGVNKH